MMLRTIALGALLALAACTDETTPRPAALPAAPRRATTPPLSPDRLMGQDARTLTGLLGTAALDLREGQARKLQWRGPSCVLDAYLYPPSGGGEPKASWLDARTPAGIDMDKAACIAALGQVQTAARSVSRP